MSNVSPIPWRRATHAAFDSIVLGGARRALGMPSFSENLSAEQVRWMQAYVLDQAARAATGPARSGHH